MTTHTLTAALAVTLFLAGGYLHGRYTDRWSGNPTDIARTVEGRLALFVPPTGWTSEGFSKSADSKPGEMHYQAQFRDRNRRAVTLSVTAGRPAQVAVHTPDLCYPAAGYKRLTPIETRDVGDNRFYSAVFRKEATAGEPFRVNWAWTVQGSWQAPDFPRLAYARTPTGGLLKLYVVHPDSPDGEPDSAYREFTATIVDALTQTLFP